ncbi:MAG: hypothetical protein ACTSPI_08950 [Candidatus Heimdallarchaeaceae archaeon]
MTKDKYSWKIGIGKSIKNNLIIFVPAILAFLANVPPKYAPIASIIVYFLKNYIEMHPKK